MGHISVGEVVSRIQKKKAHREFLACRVVVPFLLDAAEVPAQIRIM
jgi:hypothetical protein